MTPGNQRLLVIGVSARALAFSAARSTLLSRHYPGGMLAIDYFGDADLLAIEPPGGLECVAVARDLGLPRSVSSLTRAALEREWDAVVYAGGLENRPRLLRLLERRGTILGNGSATVSRVRDPRCFFAALEGAGIPHAPIMSPQAGTVVTPGERWLLKSIRSGGGGKVRLASAGERPQLGEYLQKFIPGEVGSVAFVASRRSASLLGATVQLVGFEPLGSTAFRYGGNLAGRASDLLPAKAIKALSEAASEIANRFELRGLNGLDFVMRRGDPAIIEINPRYTSSMELIEQATVSNLFDMHLVASAGGEIPGDRRARRGLGESAPQDRLEWNHRSRFLAKGILYAERTVLAGAPHRLADLGCRDLPIEGEVIAAGAPVCSIMVEGGTKEACKERLAAIADAVRALLRPIPALAPSGGRRNVVSCGRSRS